MTDNVDIFKNIVFSLPDFRDTLAAIIVLGFLYSTGLFLALETFTFLNLRYMTIFFIAVFAFIIPSTVSGELLYRFLPEYPRKWGYFLALSNATILFVYGLILSGANNYTNAWHIFWIAVITVYLSNFFVLLLTVGYDYVTRIASLSAAQPLILLYAFHIFIGSSLQISLSEYLLNLGVLVLGGFILLIAFGITEYLIRANIDGVSVLDLTSGLLQKKQEPLDLGYPTRPEVQTLEVVNENSTLSVATPWIHPGPLEGFGGGRITSDIIEKLNEHEDGFFFHVPSSHKSDPTNPEDYKKIIDAVESPEKTGKASKLVKKSYGETTFYGRKLEKGKIVYMEADRFDDYEIPIFRDFIDHEDVLLVDLHNQDFEDEDRKTAWYNTDSASTLRDNLSDFLDFLEEQPVKDYSSGFRSLNGDEPVFAMVEEVDGQKSLLFGIEGNGASEELRRLRDRYEGLYDEVILFTTDTHRSIHELSSDRQVDPSRVERVISKADETLSPASIGFTVQEAGTMKLLQEDYSGMIFSINILIRLVLLTFGLLYLILVGWVFF